MLKYLALASAMLCALTVLDLAPFANGAAQAAVTTTSHRPARAHADARPSNKTGLHPDCNVTMPCASPTGSTPDQARVARGRYVARQIGFGAAIEKRAVRPRKARPALSYGAPQPSIAYTIGRPARYIAGRLVCAINVGAALAERGIKGTGSALAKSYDDWGRPSGPQPGAVAVTDRRGGGHVALVSRVEAGRVFVWNATGGRHGWHEIEYTNRHARYRVPG